MHLAGDGEGDAVLTVEVLVVVVAVAGAATAADELAVDVVARDDVVLVDAVHHTGDGLGWEMVAVPACAAWKLVCIVPALSYVPLTRASTVLSDEVGSG